jgi:predicted metalloprotease with PDZ domain
MITYHISCPNPASQFVNIQLSLEILAEEKIYLQLPAWRAGRYQLANYAQNIRGFQTKDKSGKPVPFKKVSKDCWEIEASGKIIVNYQYWAGKMDAGSAWVDEDQVYLNLVNCCFEIVGHSEQDILISLDLPKFPDQMSTLIPSGPNFWKANDYQMLADSTILAARKLEHWKYQVQNCSFHVWIHGKVYFDKNLFLDQLSAFTQKMIHDFGEFPELEYHFIFQLLTYSHYHGVEHRKGTVITIGPAESLKQPEEMEELLGISCHELYHAWNVCRIRPKELLPYDFSKETYTQNGLVLEGVTTYMGDLYLLKSEVYDLKTYLKHFEKIINRESNNFGWKNYSIMESSFDLWLDGYIPGIPDRKVSIYTRGALLAFGLDILLLKAGSSLGKVMKKMWDQFGKPLKGYEFNDFQALVRNEFSNPEEIEHFFQKFVFGHDDLFPKIENFLLELGIRMTPSFDEAPLLHDFGIRTDSSGQVTQVHPQSQAYQAIMTKDQIVTWKVSKEEKILTLIINRKGLIKSVAFKEGGGDFFPIYKLECEKTNPLLLSWKS